MALSQEQRRFARERWRSAAAPSFGPRVNVTFPCSDQDIHTFSFIKGDVFFHNHKMTDLKAMAVLDKLVTPNLTGSNACGCVKMYRFITEKLNTSEVGYGFFGATAIRDIMCRMSEKRTKRKEFQKIFPEPVPADQLIKNKFCALMTKTFSERLKYRSPEITVYDRDPNLDVVKPSPLKIQVLIGKEPNINGFLEEVSKRGKSMDDKACVDITLPLNYYSQVYTKGLAVVDGVAILAYLYDFGNGSFLGLVGKQTYGYKITKEFAVVHPERKHISYIGEEKAREILTKGKIPRSRRTKKELGK